MLKASFWLFLIISVVHCFSSLNAQVLYYDFNPDTTVQSGPHDMHTEFLLDLDQDGDIDWQMFHFTPIDDYLNWGVEIYFKTGAEDYAIIGVPHGWQTLPAVLQYGDVVGQTAPVGEWASRAAGGITGTFLNRNDRTGEPWEGVTDGYMAFAIIDNQQWRYGWIRFDVPEEADWFRVKDFAVNMTPGESLIAGEGSTVAIGDVPVVETGVDIHARGGIIVVQFAQVSPQRRSLTLYNLLGTKVNDYELSGTLTNIPVANYPTGTYLAVVHDGAQVQSQLVQVW